MIDLHLHVLPGVDDGPESIEVSAKMLQMAKVIGFVTLVATPHLDGPLTDSYLKTIESAHQATGPLAAAAGISLELGFEHKLSPDLASRLEDGEPSTLAGSRTVLVELPFSGWPHHTDQSLFALQSAGFRPLLAHPERYVAAHASIELLDRLADRGIPMQATFASLIGTFGKKAQHITEHLLLRDAVTVLASDAHGVGRRFEAVSRGYARAEQLIGPARAKQLVVENPAALLNDAPLPSPAEIEAAPASIESGWRSKLRRVTGRAIV